MTLSKNIYIKIVRYFFISSTSHFSRFGLPPINFSGNQQQLGSVKSRSAQVFFIFYFRFIYVLSLINRKLKYPMFI